MATTTSHNKKSSAVKRILSEVREVQADASTEYWAGPLEDNIFEWHFTLRGPAGTEFENGCYHGRIILPVEYPMRPPSLMMLTPNGRWELNKKICLTFTGFHEEQWQPAWGIRTAVLGVQQFMGAREQAAVGVGSLDYPLEERERLAGLSKQWRCPTCDCTNVDLLPDPEAGAAPRVQTALPGGLTIDTTPKNKPADPGQGASGDAAIPAASEAAVAAVLVNGTGRPSLPEVDSVADTTADTASPVQELTAALGAEADVATDGTASSELPPRSHTTAPTPPLQLETQPAASQSIPPASSSAERHQSNAQPTASTPSGTTAPRRRMPTPADLAAAHQDAVKLAQLDRTIKLVAALVAILIFRQIW